MAAKDTADEIRGQYVQVIYDDCVKLDNAVKKAQDAWKEKMIMFRTFQKAGETTDEMNERFPPRIRRTPDEIAAAKAAEG